jgi:hypothetical protein
VAERLVTRHGARVMVRDEGERHTRVGVGAPRRDRRARGPLLHPSSPPNFRSAARESVEPESVGYARPLARPLLGQDLALALVVQDLALDALEGVVNRLRVDSELVRHRLVG